MSSETATPPPVLWAQRKEDILLTFNVECKEPTIKIDKDSVYFKGVSCPENKLHELTIPLYAPVLPEKSAYVNKGRNIEMVLRKETKDSPYWPSLVKDKKKPHWLKIDFNKWRDEDESGEEGAGGYDIEEMLKSFGGGAGAGAGAGDKGKPSFDDLGSDSDDEELPDLE